MKTWKKILIIALCVIALSVAVVAVLAAYAYYDKNHEYYYDYASQRLSENIVMVYGSYKDESVVRLKDIRTGKFTTPMLQHIFFDDGNTEDSLVVFRTINRLRGYLNIRSGRIVIPAQYERAWNFSEGLAAVLKDGVVSFITPTGEPAFPRTFPIHYDDYSDIYFQFHSGLCVMRTINNKWGLVNTDGEWVVEPVYSSIYAPQLGFRIMTDGRKFGLLTLAGQVALPLEYDLIRRASDNRGFILVKDGFAKEVDTNFNTIVPFVYDGLDLLDYAQRYGSSSDYDEDGSNKATAVQYQRYDIGQWSGVIDLKGNVIIPARYYMVRFVSDNLFEVEVTCGGDRVLFDSNGRYVGKSNF